MALSFLGKAASFRPSFRARTGTVEDAVPRLKERVRIRPKITYAFAGDAIAISDKPDDLAKLGKKSIAEVGLCVEISNHGDTDVTIAEVGLAGWFESPQIAVHEPLLHDNEPWPRNLKPGESVIAHMASALKDQPILKSLKRAYIRTTADVVHYGAGGPALRYYVKRARA